MGLAMFKKDYQPEHPFAFEQGFLKKQYQPKYSVMADVLQTLVEAAAAAPSGDNTQPWNFSVDVPHGIIQILLDETRDPSPMNAGQCMSRIAIGAAVENMLRTAEQNGWNVKAEEGEGQTVAVLQVEDVQKINDLKIDSAIIARTSNRRVYDKSSVSKEVLSKLEKSSPEIEGVRTQWIVDRKRIDKLASLIGRSDALMFSAPEVRRSFLKNIVFNVEQGTKVNFGMPVGSLELDFVQKLAVKHINSFPNWLMQTPPVKYGFYSPARRLIKSASGLCLIVTPNFDNIKYFLAGRMVERAWLELTSQGFSAQPAMSIIVLQNILRNCSKELVGTLGRDKIENLLKEFHSLIGEIGEGFPIFLLRFGRAKKPSAIASRLPLKELISVVE